MTTGFFGKLPGNGDFVHRRLPRSFVDPWDRWIQRGVAASRTQMGETWLDTYLKSPMWRFVLAPGPCGTQGWMGVLMPSVDRVGR
jgi:type VI secretion system protein ImpM